MQKEKLIELLRTPGDINEKDIAHILLALKDFPYCQTLQLVYAKGLYNTNSILYNKQLKKTATYCGDRKILFQLITKHPNKSVSQGVKAISKNKNSDGELKIGYPLNFQENETFSFSEWLTITKVKKITRKEAGNILINQFIEKDPRIQKQKKQEFFSPLESARKSLKENSEIITETLARVYLEQAHYEKAIEAYKALSLKYPQKNSFFANQIKRIYDLKKEK